MAVDRGRANLVRGMAGAVRRERPAVGELVNRGFNVMTTATLALGGFALGAAAFSPVENDLADRLDDIGLPLMGLACLVWYLIGRNRYRRSLVPVVLTGLALAMQILAVPLERDDPAAMGDNLMGLLFLLPFFVFVVVQYIWTGRGAAVAEPAPHPAEAQANE